MVPVDIYRVQFQDARNNIRKAEEAQSLVVPVKATRNTSFYSQQTPSRLIKKQQKNHCDILKNDNQNTLYTSEHLVGCEIDIIV